MLVGLSFAAIFAIAFVLIRTSNRDSDLEEALERARETGEVEDVAEAIESKASDDDSTEWHRTIDDLWGSYHREAAARLVVEAAERSDATILQYWLGEIMQVEPKIANEVFSDAFLDEHFDPDVASRCGSSGCCG